MSYLFFETEAELDAASGHPAQPEGAGPVKRRRHKRRPLPQEVTLRDEQGWGPVTLECVDISPGGVFLASDFLFEPGDGFILEFAAPDTKETIRVWSRVVRVAEHHVECPEGKTGMAFEFIDLAPDRREELSSWAGRRGAPAPLRTH